MEVLPISGIPKTHMLCVQFFGTKQVDEVTKLMSSDLLATSDVMWKDFQVAAVSG